MIWPFVAVGLQAAATLPPIERAVRDGMARGVFPGAVVIVGRRDTVLLAQGYGHFTWAAASAVPRPESTLYDLASLTKVVATTPAVMLLVDAGKVQIDRPVRDYLPDFRGPGKERVTVRQLLAHTSGLPAYRPFYETTTDATTLRRLVMEEPLRRAPGSRVEYSDLNGMLLGWIVEAVSGRAAWRRTAPVGVWRGTPVAGRVHDQHAARLGGVAGHAGLFSTGNDLARYAQVLLRGGRTPACAPLFREATVAEFTRAAAKGRGLGWEMRDTTTADDAGTRLSAAAYGHTGFTGTSLWIDPARDLFVIVLTNRVYAPRARRSITELKAIRGRVADGAVDLLEALPSGSRARAGSAPSC
ncbi:MAG: beta-lactamase family protein [Gemmatimonadetes bacterium]|nr:beta-lactamase family protein [Gemmatimonadota bacterium]